MRWQAKPRSNSHRLIEHVTAESYQVFGIQALRLADTRGQRDLRSEGSLVLLFLLVTGAAAIR